MITFVSLFLGLVYGPGLVEVAVSPEVASVEVLLDGRRAGVLEGPPWQLEVDFGAELAPRHLEAVAYGAEGDAERREIGRVEQWLNLPQPQAALNVLLEPQVPGQPRVARLTWESAAGAEPESVKVTLDGRGVPVRDPRRVELPVLGVDGDGGGGADEFHLLQVEMEFDGHVESRVDLTFGGAYADEVSTEITAVPVLADGKLPDAAGVQGWFVKDGKPLKVLAVEKETAEIVVVLDRPFPYMEEPGKKYKPPDSLFLAEDEALRFLTTVPRQSQGVSTSFELFPISPSYGAGRGDLHWMMSRVVRPKEDRTRRPASAVAVAGLASYGGRHRRAVVLVPGRALETPTEELDPGRVRRYLERLGVPFVVWDPRSRPQPEVAVWGELRSVASLKDLAKAFEDLVDLLDRQWIVWLDGRHLPQRITLAPGVDGLELLPREPE